MRDLTHLELTVSQWGMRNSTHVLQPPFPQGAVPGGPFLRRPLCEVHVLLHTAVGSITHPQT